MGIELEFSKQLIGKNNWNSLKFKWKFFLKKHLNIWYPLWRKTLFSSIWSLAPQFSHLLYPSLMLFSLCLKQMEVRLDPGLQFTHLKTVTVSKSHFGVFFFVFFSESSFTSQKHNPGPVPAGNPKRHFYVFVLPLTTNTILKLTMHWNIPEALHLWPCPYIFSDRLTIKSWILAHFQVEFTKCWAILCFPPGKQPGVFKSNVKLLRPF